jgi:hypothetical protein
MTGTELSRPLDLSKYLSLKGALFRVPSGVWLELKVA